MRELTAEELAKLAAEFETTVEEIQRIEERVEASFLDRSQWPTLPTEAEFRGKQRRSEMGA